MNGDFPAQDSGVGGEVDIGRWERHMLSVVTVLLTDGYIYNNTVCTVIQLFTYDIFHIYIDTSGCAAARLLRPGSHVRFN